MGTMANQGRLQRFLAVALLGARIYLGYKLLALRERDLG